jgi:hypothetical protein
MIGQRKKSNRRSLGRGSGGRVGVIDEAAAVQRPTSRVEFESEDAFSVSLCSSG